MAANVKPTTLGVPATTPAPAPAPANVADVVPPPTTSTSPSTPDTTISIRITPSGKLYTYVRHALDSLNEHPEQPVEIHTRLSLNSSLPPIKVPNTSTTSEPTPTTHTGGLLPCTTTIPRLITVLEIIKREYLRLHAGKGKGLWQYNKVGSYSGKEVEEWEEQQRGRRVVGLPRRVKGKGKARGEGEEGGREGAVGAETGKVDAVQQMDVDTAAGADGADAGEGQGAGATTTTTTHADKVLTDILNGGPNHIKMRHTPYMSVIISTRPLPHLLNDPEISYQPVKPLGRRKARRARRKGQSTLPTDGADVAADEEEEPAKKKARVAGSSDAAAGAAVDVSSDHEEEVEEVEVVEGSSDGYEEEEEGETMEVEE